MADDILNPTKPPILAQAPAQPVPEAPTAPRIDRADKLAFVAAALPALVVYLITLAPEVTLEDSGVLTTSAAYAGVPGPPAYPAWVIYSWLFTKLLPFSNLAWRVAFGSALATAVSCGLVAQMISFGGNALLMTSPKFSLLDADERHRLRIACGCVAGLTLGFSNTVWHEAVIVSTEPITLLLFTGILWLLTRGCLGARRPRWLYATLFLFGVLLTNSQLLLVALPGLVCLVVLCEPRLGRDVGLCVLPLAALLMADSQVRAIPWLSPLILANWPCFGTFAAGLLVVILAIIFTRSAGSHWKPALISCLSLLLGWLFYIYPVIASMSTPPVNWGYPRDFEGFQWLLARGIFCGYWPNFDFGDYTRQVISTMRMICHDFGWACSAIALIPLGLLAKPAQRERRWLLGLVAVGVCVSLVMVAILNPSPDRQGLEIMQSFFSPTLVIVAVFMGIGLLQIGALVARPAARSSS